MGLERYKYIANKQCNQDPCNRIYRIHRMIDSLPQIFHDSSLEIVNKFSYIRLKQAKILYGNIQFNGIRYNTT